MLVVLLLLLSLLLLKERVYKMNIASGIWWRSEEGSDVEDNQVRFRSGRNEHQWEDYSTGSG